MNSFGKKPAAILKWSSLCFGLLRASRSSEKFLKNPLVQRHDFSTYQGTRLGAYLVDRQIGEGGMGVVYRAMRADDAYKRVTALKIMRPEYKTPEEGSSDFTARGRSWRNSIIPTLRGSSTAGPLPTVFLTL